MAHLWLKRDLEKLNRKIELSNTQTYFEEFAQIIRDFNERKNLYLYNEIKKDEKMIKSFLRKFYKDITYDSYVLTVLNI